MMVCARCGGKFRVIQAQLSVTIPAPKEKVYAMNADYPNWPKFFPNYKSVRLVSENGNERVLESVVTNRKGRMRTSKQIQRIISSERIEEEVPLNTHSNLLFTTLSLRIIRTYETVQEGTRVVVTVFLQPGRYSQFSMYRLLKRRMENQISSNMRKQLELTKKAAEGT
jgi:uncharacterized membrane protein